MTAIKTKIKSLVNGTFVKREGFESNYVLSADGMRLSRVRILATVVDKFISDDRRFASITLDDGYDTVRARVFTAVSMFDDVQHGDIIDLFGKVREYDGEIYVMPELIAKINDPNLEILRELELRKQEEEMQAKIKQIFAYQKQVSDLEELKKLVSTNLGIPEEDVETLTKSEQETVEESKDKEKILELIGSLDKGDGCEYAELLETAGMPEDVVDSMINELLTDGDCFEPRPGKIKKL